MYRAWPKRQRLSAWRVALAFLIVPGAAAMLMALIMPAYDGLPTAFDRWLATTKIYALVGDYPLAILLGVPAFFMLRRHFAPHPLPSAVSGAGIAAMPWLFVTAATSSRSSASVDGRATMIDGTYTAFGWLMNAYFLGQIACVGAIAGLLFWAIAAAGRHPEQPAG